MVAPVPISRQCRRTGGVVVVGYHGCVIDCFDDLLHVNDNGQYCECPVGECKEAANAPDEEA